MIENLQKILDGHRHKESLTPLLTEIIEFMSLNDWRGACHESCGIQYVLLSELGISCKWRLGEVFYKELKVHGNSVCFDHSWILIEDEIYDLALFKTNHPDFDSFPTVRNTNLKTLEEPEVIYDTESGWGDDPTTQLIKTLPLSTYFDNSPVHPQLGTWHLVTTIGEKLGLKLSVDELRTKYNGIFWK